MLGQPSASTSTGGSLFGSSTNLNPQPQQQQQLPQAGNIFQQQQPTTQPSFNLFGQPATNTYITGNQPQQQSTLLFGQSSQQQQPQTSSLFSFNQPSSQPQSTFSFQPQQQQQPVNSALTSIAPPLPSVLTNITLQPPKPSTTDSAKADKTGSQQQTASWRIKLRESNSTVTEVVQPAKAKPAVLMPRRYKTLTVETPSAAINTPSLSASQSLRSSPSSSKNLLELKGVTSVVENPQFGDFYTTPSESVLSKYTPEQLKSVSGFIAGKKGVGKICFLKPVDLSDINLDDLFHKYIVFSPSQVVVYPDTETKMPPGKGLNQPAEIRLERCWPINRSTRQPITDEGNERYKQHIERLKGIPDTTFVDFINDTGTWVFKVDHFSGYGVPEEIRVVDVVGVVEGREEVPL
jgi:nuclear pore complex protein Nup98-Nup96